jgi:hypothetical protein
MFKAPLRCARHDDQPAWLGHPMHIEEGGEPIGVVLEAFARDRDVEASIRKIDFMTGAHQVYAGSFAEVRADVFAVGKNLPDRAVNIVRTHFQNAYVRPMPLYEIFVNQ